MVGEGPQRADIEVLDVKRRLILSVLLAALAGLAYLNALHNPFVYDDRLTVLLL